MLLHLYAVLVALSATVRRRAIEPSLFLRLIEANRRDQIFHRYPDRAALLDYCEHSATPVGRMVLGLAGAGGEDLEAMADATCIGLQLAPGSRVAFRNIRMHPL